MRSHLHLLPTLLLSITIASAAPTGSWRWINLADWHGAEKHVNVWEHDTRMNKGGRGWRSKGYDSLADYQAAMRDADVALISRIKQDHGGELLVIPGDTNGGHWYAPAFRTAMRTVYPDLDNDAIVRRAAHLCYGGMRNAFAEAGYRTMVVSVGDHELGDNPWQPGQDRSRFVPTFRSGFADVFNEEPRVHPENPDNPRRWKYEANATNSNRLFNTPIGRVPSRPLGTPYEETSFAWQHKNVLFITIDAFRQDDINRKLGEEGSVVGDCEGAHLRWLEAVLDAARDIPTIRHIVAQSHLPVIYPVRKFASSGMMMEHNIDAPVWQALRDGGVDLYLAGEVHSNTVTIDPESDLVQWVCRGNNASNFSTVDVEDDKLTIHTWKNGTSQQEDELLGTLVIDKSKPGRAVITTTGLLKAIDPSGLNIHYSFDEDVPASSILTGAANPTVNRTKCDRAFENHGEFSNEYTAWTKNTSVAPGRIGNCVTLSPGKSVLGLSSIGPISHSHPRTIAMWIRTTSATHQVLFNTTSFWGKGRQFFNLHLQDGQLELMLAPTCNAVAGGPKLNDGNWHHIAAVVPAQGSTLDDVQLYIDGIPQANRTTRKGGTKINTAQANWMGLGIILADSSLKLDKQLGIRNFDGSLDDFALWTRALTPAEIKTLVDGAAKNHDASAMERKFRLPR